MPAHSPPNSTEYTLLPRQICWVDIENLASGKSCQISNPSAASSSFSVAPSNLRRFETVMDRETFARLQCRRDGIPSTMNFNRRVRDRSVDIGSSEFSRYSENRGLNQQFGSTGNFLIPWIFSDVFLYLGKLILMLLLVALSNEADFGFHLFPCSVLELQCIYIRIHHDMIESFCMVYVKE